MFDALRKHANRAKGHPGMRPIPKHITNMIEVQTPEGPKLIAAGLIFGGGTGTLLLAARTELGAFVAAVDPALFDEGSTLTLQVEPDGKGGGSAIVTDSKWPAFKAPAHVVKPR